MVWILLALVFISGTPQKAVGVFESADSCETAKAEFIKAAIAANANEGSITCTPVKINIGTFS